MAKFVGLPVVVGDSDDIHSSEVNKLGTIATDAAGNEYIFLLGVAAVIAGSWVTYDEAFATIGLDSDVAASIVGPVAVAQAAVVAAKYGFFMVKGTCAAGAATSAADNGKVFATATVFITDDAAVTGNQVYGAIYRGAEGSGLAVVQLNYPWIGAADAVT